LRRWRGFFVGEAKPYFACAIPRSFLFTRTLIESGAVATETSRGLSPHYGGTGHQGSFWRKVCNTHPFFIFSCILYVFFIIILSPPLDGIVFEADKTPGIGELQTVLERAWHRGFDPAGAAQLDHEIKNTEKWIGATEVTTILRSLGFRSEITDFRRPTTEEGTHPLLFETIINYFNSPSPFGDRHPPVFLQFQGHSMTIIGYEEVEDRLNLLIYDPGSTPEKCRATLDKGELRLFRHSLRSLRKPQYQIVQVIGLFVNEREQEQSKLLDSKSLP